MVEQNEIVLYQPDEQTKLEVRLENETIWLNQGQMAYHFPFLRDVHDRFLLIDNTVYHIGASLKDLGKKLFAFSKMEMPAKDILKQIN